MTNERKENTYNWTRNDRLPPHHVNYRRQPKYWCARDRDKLYFINNSNDVLPIVTGGGAGYQSNDDEGVLAVGGKERTYINVQPNEAVLMDRYDVVLDSDFYLGVSIYIEEPDSTVLRFQTIAARGGANDTVLMWESGELGKSARLLSE